MLYAYHTLPKEDAMDRERSYSREGYLTENYHYFHLRDTAGQERDFHFHDFDKLVLLPAAVGHPADRQPCDPQGADRQDPAL